jgi:hypothetical protein
MVFDRSYIVQNFTSTTCSRVLKWKAKIPTSFKFNRFLLFLSTLDRYHLIEKITKKRTT